MKVIDLVPKERVTPNQAKRIELLQQLRPQIELAIVTEYTNGAQPQDMVVLVVLGNLKKEFASLKLEGDWAVYVVTVPRSSFSEHLKEAYPTTPQESLDFFNVPPPSGFVYVVVATGPGFTTTALGEYRFEEPPSA